MTTTSDDPLGAPAADHAHLCNHPAGAPGDTSGCPRWPACLGGTPSAFGSLRFDTSAAMTPEPVEAFIESWQRAARGMAADLERSGLVVTPVRPASRAQRFLRASLAPLRRLRAALLRTGRSPR